MFSKDQWQIEVGRILDQYSIGRLYYEEAESELRSLGFLDYEIKEMLQQDK